MDEKDKARRALHLALEVELIKMPCFELYRMKDNRSFRFMHYDGENYSELCDYLIRSTHTRKPLEQKLRAGEIYNVNGKNKFVEISPSKITSIIASNNYIIYQHDVYNLLFNFEIARYLIELYPGIILRNTIEVNDETVKNIPYSSLEQLDKIPEDSYLRKYKVWFLPRKVVKVISDLIPDELINSYLQTPAFDQEYEVFIENGFKGVKAYQYRTILPAIYKEIHISNYRSSLQDQNGKWGLFNLKSNRFLSDFDYDRIEEDLEEGTIKGFVGEEISVLADFRQKDNQCIPYCSSHGLWGLKKNDEIILQCCFDYIKSLGDGTFEVFNDGHYGLYDHQGNVILPCEYDVLDYDDHRSFFIRVCKDDKWGIVRRDGLIITDCLFSQEERSIIYDKAIKDFIHECWINHSFIPNYVEQVGYQNAIIKLPTLGCKVTVYLQDLPINIRADVTANHFLASIRLRNIAIKISANGNLVGDYAMGEEWLQEKNA